MGAALASLVAYNARRAGSLSPLGAVAAALSGTVAVAAGWRWAALLLAFFIPASLLSTWRSGRKAERTIAIVEKSGARDALQVLANGGVFVLAAAGALLAPHVAPWWIIGAGALAAAASDTWATEIGTALGGTPRSLVGGRRLAPGESGGITAIGTAGGVAGAAGTAALALVLMPDPATQTLPLTAAIAAAGVCGMLADSLLGATAQARRWCATCAVHTERREHPCGTRTDHARGLTWLGNDTVNLLATVTGAATALAFARWLRIV